MQWLADSNLLEMIVDKLNPLVSGTFSHSLMQLIKYLYVSTMLAVYVGYHWQEY